MLSLKSYKCYQWNLLNSSIYFQKLNAINQSINTSSKYWWAKADMVRRYQINTWHRYLVEPWWLPNTPGFLEERLVTVTVKNLGWSIILQTLRDLFPLPWNMTEDRQNLFPAFGFLKQLMCGILWYYTHREQM